MQKRVRFTRQEIRHWPRRHIAALIITALYTVAAVVLFLMPFHVDFYVTQFYLRIAAATVLGFVMFPPMLFIDPAQADAVMPWRSVPTGADLALTLLIAVLGLLVALLIEVRWRRGGWQGKLGVIFGVGMSLAVGFGFSVWRFGDTPAESMACERFWSEANGVRIVIYTHESDVNHWFLLVTRDGGDTWDQFMDFAHDRPTSECNTIGAFDERFFWVWTKGVLATTHDAGQHWEIWTPAGATLPRYVNVDYARIENIVFDDPQHGTMFLRPTQWWTQDYVILRSENGGATWLVDEDAA